MRKIINNPEHVVDEMMEGYISAYSRYYVKHPDVNGVILKQKRKDKVALVIGGGSGHSEHDGGSGKRLSSAEHSGDGRTHRGDPGGEPAADQRHRRGKGEG